MREADQGSQFSAAINGQRRTAAPAIPVRWKGKGQAVGYRVFGISGFPPAPAGLFDPAGLVSSRWIAIATITGDRVATRYEGGRFASPVPIRWRLDYRLDGEGGDEEVSTEQLRDWACSEDFFKEHSAVPAFLRKRECESSANHTSALNPFLHCMFSETLRPTILLW